MSAAGGSDPPGAAPQGAVRVVLASSAALVRRALGDAVGCTAGLALVAVSDDPTEAVRLVDDLSPDVTLLHLHGRGAIDACAAMKVAQSATRVLVLGTGAGAEELLACVEAGADGYVSVDSEMSEVLEAVGRLAAGEASVPPGMLGALLASLIRRRRVENAASRRLDRLSRREREILACMIEGIGPHAIAEKLFLSRHTVRTHVQNVLHKLEVHSRAEAIGVALESGAFDDGSTQE